MVVHLFLLGQKRLDFLLCRHNSWHKKRERDCLSHCQSPLPWCRVPAKHQENWANQHCCTVLMMLKTSASWQKTSLLCLLGLPCLQSFWQTFFVVWRSCQCFAIGIVMSNCNVKPNFFLLPTISRIQVPLKKKFFQHFVAQVVNKTAQTCPTNND